MDGANPSLKSRMGTLGHSKNESDVDQYSDEDDLDKVVDINTMNDNQDWGMPVVLKRVKEEKDKDRLAKKRINDAKGAGYCHLGCDLCRYLISPQLRLNRKMYPFQIIRRSTRRRMSLKWTLLMHWTSARVKRKRS